jgi:hypothetical protein
MYEANATFIYATFHNQLNMIIMKKLYHAMVSAMLFAALPLAASAATPKLITSHSGSAPEATTSVKERIAAHKGIALKDEDDLTTDRPAGDYRVYTRGGSSLFYDWDGVCLWPQDGMYAEAVFAYNGDVWLRNTLTYINNNIWIKGTLSADGTKISFPAGIALSFDKWSGQYVYLYPCTFDETTGNATINPDILEITFSVADNVLSLDNTSADSYLGIGGFYDDGTWSGMMDLETVYAPSGLAPVSVPTDLNTSRYQLLCVNENGYDGVELDNLKGEFLTIGRDGNDIYVSGLLPDDASVWVKGTVDGNVAKFPKDQFVGISYGYPVFFEGVTYTSSYYDFGWGGYTAYTYTISADDVTFNISADGSLTNGSLSLMLSISTEEVSQLAVYIDPEITPEYTGAAMPKTPKFTAVDTWEEAYPYYAAAIRTSQIDTENLRLLDRSKMFYAVEVDGEPYTFDPATYTTLTEPLTEVPIDFDDNDFFVSYDNYQTFYIFRSEVSSIGVKVIYYGGDTRSETPTTLYAIDGIKDVTVDTPAADIPATVYDLSGRPVNSASLTPGIYIANHRKFVVK